MNNEIHSLTKQVSTQGRAYWIVRDFPKRLLCLVFCAFSLAACAREPLAAGGRQSLTADWLLQSSVLVPEDGEMISTIGYAPRGWFKTAVPSTVLSALVKNGVYPDPRVGMNSYEICTGHDAGATAASNMSVHSGTKATFHQTIPPIPLQRDKVCFSFVRSDGDGMNFLRYWYRKLFNEPSYGRMPMGWQIGTAATDLMPDILDYFYKHASPNHCFVNALTGVGYIWENHFAEYLPADQQKQVWDDYVRYSEEYRARLDATVMSTIFEMSPAKLARFAGMPGMKGIFANYGRMAGTTLDNEVFLSAGRPVFRAINSGPPGDVTTPAGCRTAADFMIKEILDWTPKTRPAFLHIFLGNWLKSLDVLELVAKGLGPEYLCVRPDQLPRLYQAANR